MELIQVFIVLDFQTLRISFFLGQVKENLVFFIILI